MERGEKNEKVFEQKVSGSFPGSADFCLVGGDNPIASCYAAWFRAAEKPIAMQPLYSIGLRVWILVACCLINALKKNRQWLIAVPVLVLLVGLWLGTPVYSEFRYAYPVILTSPFILTTTLYSPEKSTRP